MASLEKKFQSLPAPTKKEMITVQAATPASEVLKVRARLHFSSI